jgi:hypothetical protein
MQAERDYLRARVFPEIEERLRRRYHFLGPIDLGWGVRTISASEQDAEELLVLRARLAEIARAAARCSLRWSAPPWLAARGARA